MYPQCATLDFTNILKHIHMEKCSASWCIIRCIVMKAMPLWPYHQNSHNIAWRAWDCQLRLCNGNVYLTGALAGLRKLNPARCAGLNSIKVLWAKSLGCCAGGHALRSMANRWMLLRTKETLTWHVWLVISPYLSKHVTHTKIGSI